MKVLFLVPKKDAPSTKWRVLQFLPALEKAGLACEVEEWPAGMFARMALAKKAAGYDVTVLQKRLLPKLLANRLRKNAKALVFEFDDLLMLKKGDEGGVKESPTRDRRFRRSVRTADAVVVPNETLADHARRARPEEPGRIHVIPTVIDLARWKARPPGGEPGKAVVGWMGTPQNLKSMELLRQPFARLCRRFDHVEVKIVCDADLPMENVRLSRKPFSAADEVADVQSFDVAVAPLVEDPWTRGKTSTKILAYFAAGVPVVASDVSANRLYVRDGENGFLVGTLQQWEERLAKLIDEPALRASMGAKARESVEKDFSLDSAVPKYIALLEGALGSKF